MLKSILRLAVLVTLTLSAGLAPAKALELRLFDLANQTMLSGIDAVERLGGYRFVLVGEYHDHAAHHRAQLMVIEALHRSGRRVAVGLEMFRKDSQPGLDGWVAGETNEDRFKSIYRDNWNFDWELYRPIFAFARHEKIPMAGLNVPGAVTSQVAFHGFESLNANQKGSLEGITCDVTAEYRDFIRRAYGAHGHGQMAFGRFCEAQLVWDTAMAVHAVDFLQQRPDTIMVILTGTGHARKLGIPAQLAKKTSWPVAVLLPQIPGIFDAVHTTVQDGDFIILTE